MVIKIQVSVLSEQIFTYNLYLNSACLKYFLWRLEVIALQLQCCTHVPYNLQIQGQKAIWAFVGTAPTDCYTCTLHWRKQLCSTLNINYCLAMQTVSNENPTNLNNHCKVGDINLFCVNQFSYNESKGKITIKQKQVYLVLEHQLPEVYVITRLNYTHTKLLTFLHLIQKLLKIAGRQAGRRAGWQADKQAGTHIHIRYKNMTHNVTH